MQQQRAVRTLPPLTMDDELSVLPAENPTYSSSKLLSRQQQRHYTGPSSARTVSPLVMSVQQQSHTAALGVGTSATSNGVPGGTHAHSPQRPQGGLTVNTTVYVFVFLFGKIIVLYLRIVQTQTDW